MTTKTTDSAGGLMAGLAWGHFGAALAFVALALLQLAGDHLGLVHLTRGLTGAA